VKPRTRQYVDRFDRARDLVGRRVALTRSIQTTGGLSYDAGAEGTVRGFRRGRFSLNMACGDIVIRGVGRDAFRPIEDISSQVISPVSPAFTDPADVAIELASYADRAVFVRSLRDWIGDHPGKRRWTLTRDQIRAILSVLDSVLEEP